ncbi:YedE-related selenium metabolism membrane protein [Ruminococcaceae bacterium OttesenSCG-928-I18]|nr:YedE-related selenium metabolism membrane protein [Ruminococcaceae bacterium OttesenSCG-928-I18]
MSTRNQRILLLVTGLVIGAIAVALVWFGNPKNMGFCIACFIRDIAGGIGLHRAEPVQYIRPEIIGMVLGTFLVAAGAKEFKVRGGSSPVLRFVLGFVMMVGALMFLGCPLRMILRLAGGDMNALFGLAGFVGGILVGIFFLNRGFTLKRTYTMPVLEGFALPAGVVALLLFLVAGASFLFFSVEGPGSMHAPVAIALVAGLVVGALAQRSRLCMAGGIRDVLLFKDPTLLLGFLGIFAAALVGNLALGYFNLGFADQPVAHTDGVWNFLGMVVVGFAAVLLGGCPLRQLVLAGEGNSDSVLTVLGMLVGAACCHNFKLASSAEGPTPNGKIAVIIGLVILVLVAVLNSELLKKKVGASSGKGAAQAE